MRAQSAEQNTVDAEVRQQIEAVIVKFDEAFNRRDAAAIAALYTQDAVEVKQGISAFGVVSGRQAIGEVCSRVSIGCPDIRGAQI